MFNISTYKKFLFNRTSILILLHDSLASLFAWYFSFLLRFNFEIPPEHFILLINSILITLFVQTLFFLIYGLYRSAWRFSSILDLKRICLAVLISSSLLVFLFFIINVSVAIPRSVFIIDTIVLIIIMGGSRFVYRAIKEHEIYGKHFISGEPVFLLGACDETIPFIRELSKSKDWKVVGILTEDPKMYGREILGINVVGGLDLMPTLKLKYGVRHIIVVTSLLKSHFLSRLSKASSRLGIKILVAPNADDLLTGKLAFSQIKPIDSNDLLGRDVVNLDNRGIQKLIKDQSVMVTGAAGSIGSELCRQILRFKPKLIICFDISESALYQLEQSLNKTKTHLIHLIGDVKNKKRIDYILSNYKPSLVFHAAAYKHVPMMEDKNIVEAFNNNVIGTFVLAKACQKAKVDKLVFISTDKAVNPTNIMGASKRLAEMVCQSLQKRKPTKFIIVRFGNVLGSSGSVIPKFQEQIKKGGPVTVTHPKITRYFMSIPEATQLVLQAGFMGDGGEIFVLDMGEPVKIIDLAKNMIKLSGFQIDEIKIKFTGLRPGEKLYEELLADNELSLPTNHPKLRIAKARNFNALNGLLGWIKNIQNLDEKTIKVVLARYLKEYSPFKT
ncbi:COG1086 Predicted nucleoside-diphosphate sugar epimerases [Candidatus Methylopumilus planktonicus]|uniref:polysaccharide biosynthesis protein n=1 Tax=Candidatus Methylopumilus planktonicus TaxID=1581557 RepID=UPI003BEF3359